MLPVALRIHAMPEPAVGGRRTSFRRERAAPRVPAPTRSLPARKDKREISLEEEKSTVDPVVLNLWFLRKFHNDVAIQPHLAKA